MRVGVLLDVEVLLDDARQIAFDEEPNLETRTRAPAGY
jgi:hypothetical protein